MSTSDQPPAAPAPAPVPAKKSNTLVIVLCVILGLFLLILASCVGTCIYVGKKAKDYSEASEKHPQVAALALAVAITPGIEVVSKDLEAGTIVLKNKKTGEVVNLDAKDFSQEKVASVIEQMIQGKGLNVKAERDASANATDAESGAVEKSDAVSDEASLNAAQTEAANATVRKFRSDFPLYTSGGATTVDASHGLFAGISSSQHVFVTTDSPTKVMGFYDAKLVASGFSAVASENGTSDDGATVSRVYQKGGMSNTFNIAVGIEEGKTRVEVNQVVLKQ